MVKQVKKDYTFAVGRRKGAVARVRLYSGRGESSVNSKPVNEYFNGAAATKLWSRPFDLTKTAGKYWVSVKVEGGGKAGQLDAVVLGMARALSTFDPDLRPSLKKHGLLTRDARIRERRKVGTGGKSRRKKQSPKR